MTKERPRGHPPVPADKVCSVRMALLVTPGDAKKIHKVRGAVPLSAWLRDVVQKAIGGA